MKANVAAMLMAFCSLQAACTENNPTFADGGGADLLPQDQGQQVDLTLTGDAADTGAPQPDTGAAQPDAAQPDAAQPDAALWADQGIPDVGSPDLAPDTNALPCSTDADCNDGQSCTVDSCDSSFSCQHVPVAGWCFIDGVCYLNGAQNWLNSCESCQAAKSDTAWSLRPDDAPCADDGFSCTTDRCAAGSCTHQTSAGWCLIQGSCVQDGAADPTDPCNGCVADQSTTGWTFLAGEVCSANAKTPAMCFAGSCHQWAETIYTPPPSQSAFGAGLNSVAQLSTDGTIWAAGEIQSYMPPTKRGVLLPLGTSLKSAPVYTKVPLRAIHHRLAAGDNGMVWLHDGLKWDQSTQLSSLLQGHAVHAAYGLTLPNQEVFYVGGYHGGGASAASGVVRCTVSPLGFTSCQNQSGFVNGTFIGGVVATKTAAGTQGPAWAISAETSGNEPEDIYAHSGSGTTWSRKPPAGCQDQGNTPCANTPGGLRDIYGSSASDLWVVGSSGNLLHYDGTQWIRLQQQFKSQGQQTFTAVFSSPKDKLVTLAAYNVSGAQRQVALYNYNRQLKRWFGPLILRQGVDNSVDEIRDMGGPDYNNLWLVGRRLIMSGTTPGTKGWILHLQ